MPMLEGKVDHVIGVDTHRDAHTAAILDATVGCWPSPALARLPPPRC